MYLTDGSGSADFTIPISQLRKPDWPYVGKVSEKHYILRGSPKYGKIHESQTKPPLFSRNLFLLPNRKP